MKKPFTVTKDMHAMSHDKLKGAMYNVEELANAMYFALEAMFDEHYSTGEAFSVLTISPRHFSSATKFYLPSVDGRMVEIPGNRPDSFMRWKLQFFYRYGNLTLDVQFTDPEAKNSSVQVAIPAQISDGYTLYVQTRRERERSDAALYESMRKTTKFK